MRRKLGFRTILVSSTLFEEYNYGMAELFNRCGFKVVGHEIDPVKGIVSITLGHTAWRGEQNKEYSIYLAVVPGKKGKTESIKIVEWQEV